MNPEAVKRREYAGLCLIVFGVLACAAVLTTIPNLVRDAEEGAPYL